MLYLLGFLVLLLPIVYRVYMLLTIGYCKSSTCLVGKTAIVTGGNSGIGYETVLGLASRGCRVIIADIADAEETQRKVIFYSGNSNIVTKYVDLSSLESVRNFAKHINETEPALHILINNAGAYGLGNNKSEDGLDMLMQVNYFGPFLLTHLLADLLKKSALSRVIFLTSILSYGHCLTENTLNGPSKWLPKYFYDFFTYNNTKACTLIAAKVFAEKFKGTGVTSNAVNPGNVNTNIYVTAGKYYTFSKLFRLPHYLFAPLICRTPHEGAFSSIKAAVSKKYEEQTGLFFMDCKPKSFWPYRTRNKQFRQKIWELSENFVKLRLEERL